jgi:hypothetical protein
MAAIFVWFVKLGHYRPSGWSSDNGPILIYDPVMGCAARHGILLRFQQPMQSFGGRELDAVCIALSTVNRLDWLSPA